MKLLEKLRVLIGRGQVRRLPGDLPSELGKSLSAEEIDKMLHTLEALPVVELTCDEVFLVLDEFAEAAARGENVVELMPLVYQHVMKCPHCLPRYQALLRVLQALPA